MATLSEIEAAVQRVVSKRITELDSSIATHIQRAQSTIEDRCIFRCQHSTTVIQATASVTFDKPSDYIEMRNPPFYSQTVSRDDEESGTYSGSIPRTVLVEIDTLNYLGNSRKTGKPKYWAQTETKLAFWPLSDGEGPSDDTAGAYEIVCPYWARLATLSGPSDTNWWSENMDDVLEFAAIASLLAEHRDPATNYWAQRASQRFMEFVKSDKRQKLKGRAVFITPTQPLSSNARLNRFRRRVIMTQPPS